MGNDCCKVSGLSGTLPGQQQGPLDSNGLRISRIDDIPNISRYQLDGTYIPKGRSFGKNSLILPVGAHFDPKLYVRFFLINSFYINKYIPAADIKKDANELKDLKELKAEYEANFYKLAQKTHPEIEEKNKLEQFKKEFAKQTGELKKNMVVIKYMFKAKFIIENINQILLNSDDPKDIAHIAFPISSIFKGINNNYSHNRHKIYKDHKAHKQVYIVAVIEDQQKELINKMKGKDCCFAFSIFMKGFTDQTHARSQFSKIQKEYKNQKSVLFFTVNFPYSPEKMDPNLDYGFYINPDPSVQKEGDVIFNLMNSFKVVEAFSKTDYDLQYGHLSALYHADRVDRIKTRDPNAIRVFDICNAVSIHYLKSQSCLFRIINQKEDSLKVSRSAIQVSKASSNKNTVSGEIEAQNLINNYIDLKDYGKAIQIADKYNQSNLMKAKKLEVLYKKGLMAEATKLIKQIPQEYNNNQKICQSTEIRDFIEGKITMQQGDKKKALTMLRSLAKKMVAKYSDAFEVIGTQVITAIEEITGGVPEDQVESDLFKSQTQNKAAVKLSAINLRGISTTI